jgi:hypothetical protein
LGYACGQAQPAETVASTKAESCHGLAGVATRPLLLITWEPMQKPLAHSPVGDERKSQPLGSMCTLAVT